MRLRHSTYLITGIVILMILSAPILAQGIKIGEFVDVRSRDTEAGNQYFLGKTVSIDGKVSGDAVILGDNVDVNGGVKNDVLALGRDVRIAGSVGEDVRILGIDLFLSDSIDGEVFAMGMNVEVENEAKIGGPARLYGINVVIKGEIRDDITVIADRIIIKGNLGGNVFLKAYESLEIAPEAMIDGDLTCFSPRQPDIDRSRIGGEYRHEIIRDSSVLFDFSSPYWILWRVISAFIVGSLMIFLFPAFFGRVKKTITPNPIPSALTGFLLFFLIPVLSLVFFLIVFTFPLALSLLGVLIFFLYLGRIVIALLIGELVSQNVGILPANNFLFLLIGLGIMIIIGFLPVLGGFLVFLAELTGMGALAREFLVIIRNQKVISSETR